MSDSPTDLIFNQAVHKLSKDRDAVQGLLTTDRHPEVVAFVSRFLEWYGDKTMSSYLWELFNEVVDLDNLTVLGSLHSFVVNNILDDGAFRVDWRKTVTNNGSVCWDSNGNPKTVLVDKNHPDAVPVVVYDNDGTQDVKLLMEAMDHKMREIKQREEMSAKLQALMSQFRKK